MSKLGSRAFRLNFDIFNEYSLSLTPSSWKISNPAGLEISSSTSTAAFWWKPFHYGLDIDPFIAGEVKYIFRELYGWHQRRGLCKGNDHDFHNRFGKIYFLDLASRYFKTPGTFVGWGFGRERVVLDSDSSKVVAKSLSSGLTAAKKALFTSEVDSSRLDPSFPWYLQELIDSGFDITVFVCGESRFCFQRSREDLKSLDWRSEIDLSGPPKDEWTLIEFTSAENDALQRFCEAGNIAWGRIDFMRNGAGELVFLEFNANGQWVFLDYSGKHCLVDHVCEYLLAATE